MSTPSGTRPAQDDPMLSIVIPVFNVARYLPACLDSVLPSSGISASGASSIEVIAVDDASTDGSGALLDERARSDQRLTVIHGERTSGPGNARNLGLARARGRYVWFVDSDDLVAPGAIDEVEAKLAGPGGPDGPDQPDVLVIDYRELHPDGQERPSSSAAMLQSLAGSHAGQGPFRLADAPELINATMTAWSKVFRREFLLGLGEPFRSGIHEDVPVSCAALLRGRLSVLDQPCYRYRRSRPGSFMATSSTAHLAIFHAYEEVFAMLAKLEEAGEPGVTPAVRSAVFERAISHYASVLQTTGAGFGPVGRSGLVPRAQRQAFFRRMHQDYVRYEPDGYQPPGGARGAKLALIKRNAYWTYEALEPVNQSRVALRNLLHR